ncbi:MAG: hypothetical protein ACK500_03535 [Flavobacteriales bacterium]|jgi:hypothetical protein
MKFLRYLLPLLMLLPGVADGQCRAFTKNRVLPLMSGYVQNDNYNSAQLVPGDEAELLLTFYGNKEYRLVVGVHPILGEVDYEVLDTNNQLIYSSKDSKSENKYIFDFKTSSTQQLIVRIRVPDQQSAVTSHEGCVTVMTGYKE